MTSLITIFALYFCCALQLDLIAAQNNRQCLTPRRAAGICINLDQCQVLYSLLAPTITQADSELLSRSQCGYVNKTIQVCCPTQTEVKRIVTANLSTTQRPTENKDTANVKPCVTPYHENATCIELEQCLVLFNLVQNVNLTDANKEFLRRSQCGYENNKVLICCPDRLRFIVRSTPRSFTTQAPPKNVLPSPPHCGFALRDRIYGGPVAGFDEFPWLTLIQYTKGRNAKGFHCGGALINDRYVLTAAHCTKGRSIPPDWTLSGVRLGEYDITTNPDCKITFNGIPDCNSGHLDISVEKIVAHPRYDQDSSSNQHDIALLRLATVVSFSKFIRPICLPSAENLINNNFNGTGMEIAGWGRTEMSQSSNFKLKTYLNVWSLEDCINIYNTVNISLGRTHMCAGGVEDVGSCSVDSGGPLMVEMSSGGFNSSFVAGIASFRPVPCSRKGWPVVYTRIDSYINWIQDNVLP